MLWWTVYSQRKKRVDLWTSSRSVQVRSPALAASRSPITNVTGTGIFSRALLARPRAADIRTLTAVEPAEGMRQSYESVIANASKRGLQIRCIDGAFDDIEAETGTVDLVIAAQAFHWIGKELNAAENVMVRISPQFMSATDVDRTYRRRSVECSKLERVVSLSSGTLRTAITLLCVLSLSMSLALGADRTVGRCDPRPVRAGELFTLFRCDVAQVHSTRSAHHNTAICTGR